MMRCWWCRRKRKCRECRFKYARGFVPLCENCEKGFKDKITEVKKKWLAIAENFKEAK